MGRSDDAGRRIGEEDRRAVSGQRPADQAGNAGDDAVAFLWLVVPRSVGDQRLGGVDLVAGDQLIGSRTEMRRRPGAVLGDMVRIVP